MDTTNWLLAPERTANDPAEIIYALYPKKVGRPHAIKAIRRALKVFGFERLHAATELYRQRSSSISHQFIPHPSTWFNQERFIDDPATWNPDYTPPKLQLIDKELASCLRQAVNC